MTRRRRHEWRLVAVAGLAALPGVAVTLRIIAASGASDGEKALAAGALLAFVAVVLAALKQRAAWPLRTLSNLLAGLREGDFSLRMRGGNRADALGELVIEANSLAAALRNQRLSAMEATSLLRAVMAEIDVAILVFDPAGKLRLANRAAERLLALPAERMVGAAAAALGLGDCLEGESARTVERDFPGGSGRFAVRRATVREGGVPHQLLVVANLSSALREEERLAWQRLIRVLGHELNNSLAPIKSIAGSLARRVGQPELGAEARGDLVRGLAVIEERADSLARFMEGYSRLARLPAPRRRPIDLPRFAATVAALEKRVPVVVAGGPDLELQADPDQLQQLLINLLANAAEASLESEGAVELAWRRDVDEVVVTIADRGPGLANAANLFVPFFTTKPKGSGIGLVLCRQIAEAHGGSLRLVNREQGPGCLAELRLPVVDAA